jgi:TonB family protein
MRKRLFLVLFLSLICCLGKEGIAQGQQASGEPRKVIHKTMPMYPEIARRMNLSGTVKVLAVVAPDGNVKSVQPMGGSPVLIQAAQDAVYKWKFATGGAETKEPIELHFDPQ